jgi:hypothetical protein
MFFTYAHPLERSHSVRLYQSLSALRASSAGERLVFAVALRYEAGARHVGLLEVDSDTLDPAWRSAAEEDPDGAIVVRGPIPMNAFKAFLPVTGERADEAWPELTPDAGDN